MRPNPAGQEVSREVQAFLPFMPKDSQIVTYLEVWIFLMRSISGVKNISHYFWTILFPRFSRFDSEARDEDINAHHPYEDRKQRRREPFDRDAHIQSAPYNTRHITLSRSKHDSILFSISRCTSAPYVRIASLDKPKKRNIGELHETRAHYRTGE